jgi:hypothetical protein
MSGFLGLLGGGAPMQIGSVTLDDWSTPELVTVGGTQNLVIHELPGGAKVIDTMGSFSKDLTWTGMMLGPGAVDQALAIDGMRDDALPIELTFDEFIYTGLIKTFEADYKRSNWIGQYRITFVVLPDDQGVPPASASQQGSADVQSASNSAQYGPPAPAQQFGPPAPAARPVATKVNVTNSAGKASSYNFGSDFPVV